MLVILSGLPGTGKTTLARLICQRLHAVYLRIDTIEALLAGENASPSVGAAGYVVAYGLARENLRIGNAVVADSVNSLEVTRRAWRDVAASVPVDALDVEIVCSDPAEHRRRIEARLPDMAGRTLPAWSDVLGRPYDPWGDDVVSVDTAGRTPDDCVAEIVAAVGLRLRRNL